MTWTPGPPPTHGWRRSSTGSPRPTGRTVRRSPRGSPRRGRRCARRCSARWRPSSTPCTTSTGRSRSARWMPSSRRRSCGRGSSRRSRPSDERHGRQRAGARRRGRGGSHRWPAPRSSTSWRRQPCGHASAGRPAARRGRPRGQAADDVCRAGAHPRRPAQAPRAASRTTPTPCGCAASPRAPWEEAGLEATIPDWEFTSAEPTPPNTLYAALRRRRRAVTAHGCGWPSRTGPWSSSCTPPTPRGGTASLRRLVVDLIEAVRPAHRRRPDPRCVDGGRHGPAGGEPARPAERPGAAWQAGAVSIAGLVLAAGAGRRMGRPKALVRLPDGGPTLLETAARAVLGPPAAPASSSSSARLRGRSAAAVGASRGRGRDGAATGQRGWVPRCVPGSPTSSHRPCRRRRGPRARHPRRPPGRDGRGHDPAAGRWQG